MSQWRCPICGTSIAVRVYRKPLLGKVTVPPDDEMTVVAYRCQNDHICLAQAKEAGEKRPHDLAA
jgi:hypothetical protein